jgi:hypothetical protein
MPIQSDDIKLLRSAVMADVPEGGGAATGIEVVDGQSNNIFPDTSSDDRASGRFRLRKVFGAAQTDDTDLLLGASFAVLSPPEDPLVHVNLVEVDDWFSERTGATDKIERYLVKGSRLLSRIQDVHYQGALLLQLYNIAPGTSFPEPGDTIVVRNPSGQEQYVRVLKTTLSTATVFLDGGQREINLCSCELSNELEFDLQGKAIQLTDPSASNTAVAYSTTPSVGARFYGVKPLGIAAEIGDRSVTTEGGIFSPIVPAATVEEPVLDVYPLVPRPSLSRTSAATLTLPAQSLALGPGTVLRMPTAAEPSTVAFTHGATAFSTNNQGQVLQGSTVVGSVDYRSGSVTMSGSAPSYGTQSLTLSYRPATVVGALAHSASQAITPANQGLAWVFAFEPPPAPGTLVVSYMAQGRWYTLEEDGTGRLAGADSSYGTGTLSFQTGSLALSLGAIPDVGSDIIFLWGDAETAQAATGLPTRAWAAIPLAEPPAPGTLAFEWSRGGTTYNASLAANGTVTGPAQIREVERLDGGAYRVLFSPDTMPDGLITVSYESQPENAAFVNNGGGSYTLSGAPIAAGSLRFRIFSTASNGRTAVLDCFSRGTEIRARTPAGTAVIGTINNTTGAVSLAAGSVTLSSTRVERTSASSWQGGSDPWYYDRVITETTSFTLDVAGVLQMGYLPAAGASAQSVEVSPPWLIEVTPAVGLSLVTNSLAFTWAGAVHAARDGALSRGWHVGTAATTPVGSVSSDGLISMGQSLPGGASNSVAWANAALDAASMLNVYQGVFRVGVAPIKAGSFQLQAGAVIGSANSGGVLSGGFGGLVDFVRGIVRWAVAGLGPETGTPVRADEVTYNAVYLQYVPLDESLLGIKTTRLPLDGRVPIYRPGGQVLIHNTLTTALPNPVTLGTAYSLGRERIAAVTVRTVAGVKVPGDRYTVDFDAGEITFPVGTSLAGFDQPFTVEHRIEDELLVLRADISGRLDLVAGLTHDYPAGTSYVSSKLRKGDLFARTFGYIEQATWTGVWSDSLIGSAPTASYNNIDFPIAVTNRGAITERWAVIFTGATQVRVVGENVGQVLTNVSITALIDAINPQTGAPYFEIDPLGWGGGWAVGNVLRFNTVAAGAPAWAALTVLQGPPVVQSDAATIAFRSDVDAP